MHAFTIHTLRYTDTDRRTVAYLSAHLSTIAADTLSEACAMARSMYPRESGYGDLDVGRADIECSTVV